MEQEIKMADRHARLPDVLKSSPVSFSAHSNMAAAIFPLHFAAAIFPLHFVLFYLK